MARKHIAMCRHSREPWSEDDDLWACKRGELIKLHNMPRSGDDHSSVAATSTLSRLGSFCLTPRSPRQHIRPSYSNVDRPHWSPRYLQEPSSASSGSFAPQTYQQAQHRAHTDASVRNVPLSPEKLASVVNQFFNQLLGDGAWAATAHRWRSLMASCTPRQHRHIGQRIAEEGILNSNAAPLLCDLLEVDPRLCYAVGSALLPCLVLSLVSVLEEAADRAAADKYFFEKVKRGLNEFMSILLKRHLLDAQQVFNAVVLPLLRIDRVHRKVLVMWSVSLFTCIQDGHYGNRSMPAAMCLQMKLYTALIPSVHLEVDNRL